MRLSRARRLLSREHKPHRGEDGLPRCVQCVWAREELPAEDGGQRGRRGASEVGDAGGEVGAHTGPGNMQHQKRPEKTLCWTEQCWSSLEHTQSAKLNEVAVFPNVKFLIKDHKA